MATTKKEKNRISRVKKLAKGYRKEGLNIVHSIVKLYDKGFTRQEIMKAGFNKTTVHRQVGAHLKEA